MDIRRLWTLAAAAAALSILSPSPAGAATDNRLRVELLIDGRPMREYRDRGTTYVEARDNREYSIRLTNLEDDRVAVALAVDGRNTIDGRRTSAREARKWILEPWQSITVTGWQVGESRARRFYFTTESDSYAEWLGDTRNVGVVEAVAFREREPRRSWTDGWWGSDRDERDDRLSRSRQAPSKSSRADGPAASPPGAAAERSGSASGSASAQGSARAESRASRDVAKEDAATGIGRDVRNDVVRIEFEHEDSPSSSVRVRYEFREGLERLGVLPRRDDEDRWRDREDARGFEDDRWAPEPPRRRY